MSNNHENLDFRKALEKLSPNQVDTLVLSLAEREEILSLANDVDSKIELQRIGLLKKRLVKMGEQTELSKEDKQSVERIINDLKIHILPVDLDVTDLARIAYLDVLKEFSLEDDYFDSVDDEKLVGAYKKFEEISDGPCDEILRNQINYYLKAVKAELLARETMELVPKMEEFVKKWSEHGFFEISEKTDSKTGITLEFSIVATEKYQSLKRDIEAGTSSPENTGLYFKSQSEYAELLGEQFACNDRVNTLICKESEKPFYEAMGSLRDGDIDSARKSLLSYVGKNKDKDSINYKRAAEGLKSIADSDVAFLNSRLDELKRAIYEKYSTPAYTQTREALLGIVTAQRDVLNVVKKMTTSGLYNCIDDAMSELKKAKGLPQMTTLGVSASETGSISYWQSGFSIEVGTYKRFESALYFANEGSLDDYLVQNFLNHPEKLDMIGNKDWNSGLYTDQFMDPKNPANVNWDRLESLEEKGAYTKPEEDYKKHFADIGFYKKYASSGMSVDQYMEFCEKDEDMSEEIDNEIRNFIHDCYVKHKIEFYFGKVAKDKDYNEWLKDPELKILLIQIRRQFAEAKYEKYLHKEVILKDKKISALYDYYREIKIYGIPVIGKNSRETYERIVKDGIPADIYSGKTDGVLRPVTQEEAEILQFCVFDDEYKEWNGSWNFLRMTNVEYDEFIKNLPYDIAGIMVSAGISRKIGGAVANKIALKMGKKVALEGIASLVMKQGIYNTITQVLAEALPRGSGFLVESLTFMISQLVISQVRGGFNGRALLDWKAHLKQFGHTVITLGVLRATSLPLAKLNVLEGATGSVVRVATTIPADTVALTASSAGFDYILGGTVDSKYVKKSVRDNAIMSVGVRLGHFVVSETGNTARKISELRPDPVRDFLRDEVRERLGLPSRLKRSDFAGDDGAAKYREAREQYDKDSKLVNEIANYLKKMGGTASEMFDGMTKEQARNFLDVSKKYGLPSEFWETYCKSLNEVLDLIAKIEKYEKAELIREEFLFTLENGDKNTKIALELASNGKNFNAEFEIGDVDSILNGGSAVLLRNLLLKKIGSRPEFAKTLEKYCEEKNFNELDSKAERIKDLFDRDDLSEAEIAEMDRLGAELKADPRTQMANVIFSILDQLPKDTASSLRGKLPIYLTALFTTGCGATLPELWDTDGIAILYRLPSFLATVPIRGLIFLWKGFLNHPFAWYFGLRGVGSLITLGKIWWLSHELKKFRKSIPDYNIKTNNLTHAVRDTVPKEVVKNLSADSQGIAKDFVNSSDGFADVIRLLDSDSTEGNQRGILPNLTYFRVGGKRGFNKLKERNKANEDGEKNRLDILEQSWKNLNDYREDIEGRMAEYKREHENIRNRDYEGTDVQPIIDELRARVEGLEGNGSTDVGLIRTKENILARMRSLDDATKLTEEIGKLRAELAALRSQITSLESGNFDGLRDIDLGKLAKKYEKEIEDILKKVEEEKKVITDILNEMFRLLPSRDKFWKVLLFDALIPSDLVVNLAKKFVSLKTLAKGTTVLYLFLASAGVLSDMWGGVSGFFEDGWAHARGTPTSSEMEKFKEIFKKNVDSNLDFITFNEFDDKIFLAERIGTMPGFEKFMKDHYFSKNLADKKKFYLKYINPNGDVSGGDDGDRDGSSSSGELLQVPENTELLERWAKQRDSFRKFRRPNDFESEYGKAYKDVIDKNAKIGEINSANKSYKGKLDELDTLLKKLEWINSGKKASSFNTELDTLLKKLEWINSGKEASSFNTEVDTLLKKLEWINSGKEASSFNTEVDKETGRSIVPTLDTDTSVAGSDLEQRFKGLNSRLRTFTEPVKSDSPYGKKHSEIRTKATEIKSKKSTDKDYSAKLDEMDILYKDLMKLKND